MVKLSRLMKGSIRSLVMEIVLVFLGQRSRRILWKMKIKDENSSTLSRLETWRKNSKMRTSNPESQITMNNFGIKVSSFLFWFWVWYSVSVQLQVFAFTHLQFWKVTQLSTTTTRWIEIATVNWQQSCCFYLPVHKKFQSTVLSVRLWTTSVLWF